MAENVFAVTQSDLDRSPVIVCADARQFRTKQVIVPVAEGTAGSISFQSSGRLLPHHQLRIVSESGELLDHGHVGEIHIKRDSLFEGYYNRPDLTASAIVGDWYHTGDLGFYLEGELFVVGRKKDLIIVGGENLYPQDIEEIVASHPAIHDGRVVAMGIHNPDLGTDDIVVVAEVEREALLANAEEIELELRNLVVAGIGVPVRTILLKSPQWIVKRTAGKASRSATREKLLREHPELNPDPEVSQLP
jgi:fatty-acyl-CoA synthase